MFLILLRAKTILVFILKELTVGGAEAETIETEINIK